MMLALAAKLWRAKCRVPLRPSAHLRTKPHQINAILPTRQSEERAARIPEIAHARRDSTQVREGGAGEPGGPLHGWSTEFSVGSHKVRRSHRTRLGLKSLLICRPTAPSCSLHHATSRQPPRPVTKILSARARRRKIFQGWAPRLFTCDVCPTFPSHCPHAAATATATATATS